MSFSPSIVFPLSNPISLNLTFPNFLSSNSHSPLRYVSLSVKQAHKHTHTHTDTHTHTHRPTHTQMRTHRGANRFMLSVDHHITSLGHNVPCVLQEALSLMYNATAPYSHSHISLSIASNIPARVISALV